MKHIAAFLLLALGGNSSPNAKDIKKVIKAGGGEADSDRVDALLAAVKDKNIEDVIAEGLTKIGSIGSGGGGGGGAAAPAAAAADAPAAKKEEKKKEESEEEDDDMGFGLFD
eukprot:NODE_7396_length_442_cov_28.146032_g7230_i0.p1 GENE.NODE_7396_length_442_cov_28.146032_g7230_i0~~NODE_7396_length_442_cov_28.146032_g7230_i0.p1  ORF type:complete len:112 (-),score=33.72 NODE_7396_length_442_cov_28.146032_g7230_i0:56-391(-)